MSKFNHVGRPTNEEVAALKKKKMLKIVVPVVGSVLIIALIAVVSMNNGLGGLMGNTVTKPGCNMDSDKITYENGKAMCTRTMDARLLGDVNGDAKINIKDANAIQKYVSGLTQLDDISKAAADVDQNKIVNNNDATLIQKFIAGINPSTSGTNYASALMNETYVCPKDYILNGTTCTYKYPAVDVVVQKTYSIGDKVTYNGMEFYVIQNSNDTEATVTLLKAEPLTVEEVNVIL